MDETSLNSLQSRSSSLLKNRRRKRRRRRDAEERNRVERKPFFLCIMHKHSLLLRHVSLIYASSDCVLSVDGPSPSSHKTRSTLVRKICKVPKSEDMSQRLTHFITKCFLFSGENDVVESEIREIDRKEEGRKADDR